MGLNNETNAAETASSKSNDIETVSAETIARVEELDKESQTRKFTGILQILFFLSCVMVTLYHLYVAVSVPPPIHMHRSLHVGMMLFLTFFFFPMHKKASRKRVAIYDWVLCALSLGIPIYIWVDYINFIHRFGIPNLGDTITSTVMVLLILEAARRVTGKALPVLAILFVLYGLVGRNLPGMFGHRGYTWPQLADTMIGTEGVFGTSVGVAASYIFMFILFGAVMGKSGLGQFFNDLAMAMAGSSKGGPAKVSVIASAFLGTVNGSAVANVCTTGPFTIPLMRKCGYTKEFAGAVESAASVGGQILPPIMGAAAFIMAEVLGVDYSFIIVWALIPALLYFVGVIVQVHLRAEKTNLVGLPKDRLPKVLDVLRKGGHLLLPLIFLLYMLFFSGRTVVYSAFWTILVTIAVSWIRPETRMGPKAIFAAFADGARQTVPVAIACACVGIIVGVFARTGFGLSMADAIIRLGTMSLLLTLIFTMITCMILGLGVPSIPAYIITSTIAATALARLGITPAAAHLFVFYFAMFANITPPFGLVSFAAAGLSGGNPIRTCVQAVKLAVAGFIVPFIFVYSPALMLIDTTFLGGLWVTITAVIGVCMMCVAVEGHLFTKVIIPVRLLAIAGALGLIVPGFHTDLIGFAVLITLVIIQKVAKKKTLALS
ncbi:MAG: TRAP transporter permease [Treponema sp.]|nr:TRAP transporter permease [Treponema sp.]